MPLPRSVKGRAKKTSPSFVRRSPKGEVEIFSGKLFADGHHEVALCEAIPREPPNESVGGRGSGNTLKFDSCRPPADY